MTTDRTSIAKANAKLSTGPKTAQGKAWSKLNSFKHGILATDLRLIHGHQEEDGELLETVRQALHEEHQPATATEMILVERLFVCVWRLKRVHLAEAAMIQREGIQYHVRSVIDLFEREGMQKRTPRDSFYQRIRTSIGCQELAYMGKAILEEMEKKGLPLTEALSWHLEEYMGGKAGFTKAEMICAFNNTWKVDGHFDATPEELEMVKMEALRLMKELVSWFEGLVDLWEWGEESEQKVRLQESLLPNIEDCQKIQRYEAHIHRMFMSSLHELQRVQALRKGTSLPMAAALDVTLDGEGML